MINAYALVQSGLLLTAGSAADRYGRRRMLLIGLALFGLGSLAAGLAQTSGQLIAARAGMGVGGALLVTSTLAVAMQIFDADERPEGDRHLGGGQRAGLRRSARSIGGAMLAHFWWGAIFLVNLPVVLVSLVGASGAGTGVPRPGRRTARTWSARCWPRPAMTAIVYAIISGPDRLASARSGAAAAACSCSASSSAGSCGPRTPCWTCDLFRDRRFVGAVAGVVLITFGSAGALFLMTQHLQFVRGYTPGRPGCGCRRSPCPSCCSTSPGSAARLMRRLGLPAAIALGMALLAGGLAVVARFTTDGYGVLLVGLLLMGAGCALANPAIVEAVMSAIPAQRRARARVSTGRCPRAGRSASPCWVRC